MADFQPVARTSEPQGMNPVQRPGDDPQQEYMDSLNPLQKLAIGGGRRLNQAGAGMMDMVDRMTGDQEGIDARQLEQANAQPGYDALRADSPGLTMAGELIPDLATALIPGKIPAQIGYGAIQSALNYNPEGEYTTDALKGGALTAGVFAGLGTAGRIAQGAVDMAGVIAPKTTRAVTGGINKVLGRNVDNVRAPEPGFNAVSKPEAERLGFELTPGMETGNKTLRQIENSAESNPYTSGMMEDMGIRNQQNLNRKAIEAMGGKGDKVTPQVLGEAHTRLSKVFNDAIAEIPETGVQINARKFAKVMGEISGEAEPKMKAILKKYPGLAEGNITGKQYSELVTRLEKDISNLRGAGYGAAADDLADIRYLVDDGMERAVGSETAEAVNEARKQWGYKRVLEDGQVVTRGNINPRSLNSSLKKNYGGTFRRGTRSDDIMDAARIAEDMADIIGDSGTATRTHMQNLINQQTFMGAAKDYTAGKVQRKLLGNYLETGNEAASDLLGGYRGNSVIEKAGAPTARGAVGLMNIE